MVIAHRKVEIAKRAVPRRRWNIGWGVCCLAIAAGAACSPDSDSGTDAGSRPDVDADDSSHVPDVPIACTPRRLSCAGNFARSCNDTGDGWATVVECMEPTPVCMDDVGCTVCRAGDGTCEENAARLCRSDGSGWIEDTCDPLAGERCVAGYCTDLSPACEEARLANSYEGCDYWATQTTNMYLMDPMTFHYALVIGNRQPTDANVEIWNAAGLVRSDIVPPESVLSVVLPWNNALRAPMSGSAIVVDGAFRVKSDVPVTVYQFNPLGYWGGSTPLMPGSYTNDASLLLPRHVLTGNYVVSSRPTFIYRTIEGRETRYTGGPGFLAVVGLEDDTMVEVTLEADTQVGLGIPAHSRGSTAAFIIGRFDVLQLLSRVPDSCTPLRTELREGGEAGYCDLGADYDLTGSIVRADKPVAVYSGHDCTFIPFYRWACDHLEEQMFPLEAWGDRYIGARTSPVEDEPNVWRVISGTDGNAIAFTGGVHPAVTLDRAEWIEFESRTDFEVTGSGPLLLVQYLYGQGDERGSIGDPAMALSVPVQQYRRYYNFLAPHDYRNDPATGALGQNWVNVIAPSGATVTLDGAPVGDFVPIADTDYMAARVLIEGGSHVVASDDEFGVICYGYGNYTSYMYPGGLDIDPINPLI